MSRSAAVFGAGGAVGEAIVYALLGRGWRVSASMRTDREDVAARLREAGAEVSYEDLTHEGKWLELANASDAVVFTTHLAVAIAALERIDLNKRIVAFSSNNVAVHPEAAEYEKLAALERRVKALCPDAAIIRPTLIYGDARLVSVTRLMRVARTWPVLPLPGAGRALVQPVFHEDLARASALLAEIQGGGIYAIGGPDIVTMRAFFHAIVRAARGKARVTPISSRLLQITSPVLTGLGLVSGDQILRANRDRAAVPVTPLPPELAARVGLKEGLRRLAETLT